MNPEKAFATENTEFAEKTSSGVAKNKLDVAVTAAIIQASAQTTEKSASPL